MGTVVAVWGPANRGKTSSIKKAVDLLCDAHSDVQMQTFHTEGSIDFTVILTIKGIKIGIESQGDPNSRLPASLKMFVSAGCEIIVCATRTSGGTVKAVEALSPPYQIHWIEKRHEANASRHDSANIAIARDIAATVEAALK